MILLQQGQFALRSITSSDVHEEDWQRHPFDPYHTLLKVLTIHTCLVHKEGISYRNRVHTTVYICSADREVEAEQSTVVITGSTRSLLAKNGREWVLANQIRPTTLSAAILVRVHSFLAKKHRELPFLAIALFFLPK